MKNPSKNPRFEVDYKERLQQSRDASNAVRLPRLGYIRYRVYEIRKQKDKTALNSQYGIQRIGRGIRKGTISPIITSIQNSGRSIYHPSSTVIQIYLDELNELFDPPHVVKWLKPKHATALRLKGHRVEEC